MADHNDSGKTRQQQDFDDLNNELSGRGSKIRRFTGGDAAALHTDRDGRTAHTDALLTLTELSQAAQRRLAAINDRLDALDHRTAEDLRLAREHLQELRDNANHTRDGRLVFKSEEDGNYYDENGERVDPDNVDPGTWRDDGPSWEDYQDGTADYARAQDNRQRYEDARDRAHDPSIKEEDLDDLDADLNALERDLGPDPTVTKGPLFQAAIQAG